MNFLTKKGKNKRAEEKRKEHLREGAEEKKTRKRKKGGTKKKYFQETIGSTRVYHQSGERVAGIRSWS